MADYVERANNGGIERVLGVAGRHQQLIPPPTIPSHVIRR